MRRDSPSYGGESILIVATKRTLYLSSFLPSSNQTPQGLHSGAFFFYKMALTPTQKIALCVADLERCDDLLKSLWHEDSRREVQARRKALLNICIQESDQIDLDFTYPGEPCHPRFAKL